MWLKQLSQCHLAKHSGRPRPHTQVRSSKLCSFHFPCALPLLLSSLPPAYPRHAPKFACLTQAFLLSPRFIRRTVHFKFPPENLPLRKLDSLSFPRKLVLLFIFLKAPISHHQPTCLSQKPGKHAHTHTLSNYLLSILPGRQSILFFE